MRYFVSINGVEKTVKLSRDASGDYRCQIDDGPPFFVRSAPMHQRIHLLGERASSYISVSVDSDDISGGGPRGALQVESQRLRAMRDAAGSSGDGSNDGVVTSPMPGRVVKNLVATGDTVLKGQGVVVVEAMKMENELKAPFDGVIIKTFADSGDLVDAGAPLVELGQEQTE